MARRYRLAADTNEKEKAVAGEDLVNNMTYRMDRAKDYEREQQMKDAEGI